MSDPVDRIEGLVTLALTVGLALLLAFVAMEVFSEFQKLFGDRQKTDDDGSKVGLTAYSLTETGNFRDVSGMTNLVNQIRQWWDETFHQETNEQGAEEVGLVKPDGAPPVTEDALASYFNGPVQG